jgi:3-phosphoshikimate 1-carboxyvinyltransferase
MTSLHIVGGNALTGRCHVPGDKSISHRAILLGGIAEGTSRVINFLDGADCRATVAVMRGLGVRIDQTGPTELIIHGRGIHGLQEPSGFLDCANSGTTMRLVAGLVAGQPFATFLTGTSQIRHRPMDRIVNPLRLMGARITGRQNGRYAPLAFDTASLRAIEYEMPVASAQVKSCILLAGIYARDLTIVRQPGPARDHTERMLASMGAPIEVYGNTIHCEKPSGQLRPLDIRIAGDPSSAAFIAAAAAIVPESRVTIGGVCINDTRTGFFGALQKMGASVEYHDIRERSGEPIADIEVQYADLHAATFSGDEIVTMIDELPLIAVVASQAEGTTEVRDAAELRVKETDRIATTVSELRKLGARIEPAPDGFTVEGPTALMGGAVEGHGDHRLAMALSIAALAARGPSTVYGAEVTGDSFPGFETTLQALGADVDVSTPQHA